MKVLVLLLMCFNAYSGSLTKVATQSYSFDSKSTMTGLELYYGDWMTWDSGLFVDNKNLDSNFYMGFSVPILFMYLSPYSYLNFGKSGISDSGFGVELSSIYTVKKFYIKTVPVLYRSNEDKEVNRGFYSIIGIELGFVLPFYKLDYFDSLTHTVGIKLSF